MNTPSYKTREAASELVDEARRLERLQALKVLDTEAEPIFDSLTRMASEICGTPIALLSLVDADRQWFKSSAGLASLSETPREWAFCSHAIRGDQLMEVPDARQDPRFSDNPLVRGTPNIRFYAGAPLVMQTGDRVGTLCVLDCQARQLTPEQARLLEGLARLAVQALEMRERSIQQALTTRDEAAQAAADGEQRLRAILDAQSELVSQATPDGRLRYINPAYAAFFGRGVDELVGTNLFDYVRPEDRAAVRERIDRVLTGGSVTTTENRMVSADNQERWVSWTNTRQLGPQGEVYLHSTGRDVTLRVLAERALAHSQELLERTGRVAGVGGWELDIPTGRIHWTTQTRRIHEVGPAYQPTLESALDFYSTEARPVLEAAVQRSLDTGEPWDLELQMVTATSRRIWVRAVGEAEFMDGKPVRLFGALQDISERRAAEQARMEIAAIYENTSDFVIQADQDRRVRYMNPAAARAMLGRTWTPDDAPFVRTLLPLGTQQKFAQEILPTLQDQGIWVGQSNLCLADGSEIPASHMVIAHRDAGGTIRRYSIIFRNIAQLVAAQQETERQENTLRSVANAIPSTVSVVDRKGRYVFVNQAFERWANLPAPAILGRGVREVLGDEKFAFRWPLIQRALSGEPVRFEVVEDSPIGPRNVAVDYLPLVRPDGGQDGLVIVGQDVTEARQEQAILELRSMTDPLTKLLNRAGFEQRLQNQLDAATHAPLSILYIDLDRFKPVNDTHGHAMGDELLRQVAKRLVRLVRPTDIIARLGGDEFAIALLGMGDLRQAERVGQSVVDALNRPFQIHATLSVQIGGSVGGASGPALRNTWAELLARADRMLYAAKNGGRNQVRVERAD